MAARGALATLTALLKVLVAFLRRAVDSRPLAALLLTNGVSVLTALLVAARQGTRGGGLRAALACAAEWTPTRRLRARKIRSRVRQRIQHVVTKDLGAPASSLPLEGLDDAEIVHKLALWSSRERRWENGQVSGTVYGGTDRLSAIISEATRQYTYADGMHPDAFPSVRKMEAEVVAMVAHLLGGASKTCGALTTGGGTESIILACKAYRDYAAEAKGITEPEMVVASTAHAAFLKAAHLLRIRCLRVPADPETFRADPEAMAAAITERTILVVASAPSYAQGVVDPVEELAHVARSRGVGLHVDCCLGGFLLPFKRRLGQPVPPFDFGVQGVTSVSCDLDSYGFGPKGASVVLYAEKALRHNQYFISGDWSGGIYATPTLAGTRSGPIIAAAWSVMMALGEKGYQQAMSDILDATRAFEAAVRSVDGLQVLGSVDASIVCFGAAKDSAVSAFRLGKEMVARGWALSTLQLPPCLHFCVTLPHARACITERFAADLAAAVEHVVASPGADVRDGAVLEDGEPASAGQDAMLHDFSCAYLDALYQVQ